MGGGEANSRGGVKQHQEGWYFGWREKMYKMVGGKGGGHERNSGENSWKQWSNLTQFSSFFFIIFKTILVFITFSQKLCPSFQPLSFSISIVSLMEIVYTVHIKQYSEIRSAEKDTSKRREIRSKFLKFRQNFFLYARCFFYWQFVNAYSFLIFKDI